MEGRALARSVFPLPGGPDMSRLWPPAAATSRARLACSCPLMWVRSVSVGDASRSAETVSAGAYSGTSLSPRRWATSWPSDSAGSILRPPPARAASAALDDGTYTSGSPACRAMMAIGRTPFVGRRWPSRDSSPRKIALEQSHVICCELRRMPTAIGRS